VQGLSAAITNRASMYVADASPNAVAEYHARFEFDPNSVTMQARRSHAILAGQTPSGASTLAVHLRAGTGGYQIHASVRQNSGSLKYTPWVTISDGPHSIQIAWFAATTSNGTDGSLSIWVDGVPGSSATDIANGSERIDEVRLGPQWIGSGISGIELFDGFVSTWSSFIGP
jgi:hypothetical protein